MRAARAKLWRKVWHLGLHYQLKQPEHPVHLLLYRGNLGDRGAALWQLHVFHLKSELALQGFEVAALGKGLPGLPPLDRARGNTDQSAGFLLSEGCSVRSAFFAQPPQSARQVHLACGYHSRKRGSFVAFPQATFHFVSFDIDKHCLVR